MSDYSNLPLGKLPPRVDPRTLKLAKYLDLSALPPLPQRCGWQGAPQDWGMLGNDRLGDCTCAAAGHQIQVWSKTVGQEVTLPDADIEAAYWATGVGDTGRDELTVLNWWRNHGIGGHQITAYVDCDPRNVAHIKASIYLFGGIYIGVNLPLSAQQQTVWRATSGPNGAPGSWGGHAVNCIGYDRAHLWFVTWGSLMSMTWGFWRKYCDEAHAILSPDWINANGHTPSGFDLAAVQADLAAVTA